MFLTLTLLVATTMVVVLAGPRLSTWAGQVTAACEIVVDGQRVALEHDQAQAATQAAADRLTGSGTGDGEQGADLPPGVVDAIGSARHDTALTCRSSAPQVQAQDLTETGLTPRAQQLREAVEAHVGELPIGGFAPGGVDSGHGAESTHYEGRGIDYFYRPITEDNRDRGWVLSQWLVAHAHELTVQYVIFDDHWWGVRQSSGGWQPYRSGDGANEVLRHLDHVHVDVLRGDPVSGAAGSDAVPSS